MRTGRPRVPLTDRFNSRVNLQGPWFVPFAEPCWSWRGEPDKDGYGLIAAGGGNGVYGGKQLRAHRVSYEIHVGRVPAELVVDHLCRNRLCVNPSHLEAVTNEENIARGVYALRRASGLVQKGK